MSPRDVDELTPWEVAAVLGIDESAEGDEDGALASTSDGRGGLDVHKLAMTMPGVVMTKGA